VLAVGLSLKRDGCFRRVRQQHDKLHRARSLVQVSELRRMRGGAIEVNGSARDHYVRNDRLPHRVRRRRGCRHGGTNQISLRSTFAEARRRIRIPRHTIIIQRFRPGHQAAEASRHAVNFWVWATFCAALVESSVPNEATVTPGSGSQEASA